MGHAIVVGGVRASAPVTGIKLGDIAEGSIVKLNESGSPVEFYVAKHGYESALNGAGRTLLVRKNGFSGHQQWNSSKNNAYVSSTTDNWLKNTFAATLDADVISAIGTTKFYYTPGGGSNTVSTLSRSVFILSLTEYGKSISSYVNVEGSTLPIASTLVPSSYSVWTRSPSIKDTTQAAQIYRGSAGLLVVNTSSGADNYLMPCFTLPASTKFDAETLEFLGVE